MLLHSGPGHAVSECGNSLGWDIPTPYSMCKHVFGLPEAESPDKATNATIHSTVTVMMMGKWLELGGLGIGETMQRKWGVYAKT